MVAAPQCSEAAALLFRKSLRPIHRRLAQLVQAGIDAGEFQDVVR